MEPHTAQALQMGAVLFATMLIGPATYFLFIWLPKKLQQKKIATV